MGGGVTKETLASLTEHIPGLVSYHCAMLGLDSAGKTTVLYRLKFDQYVNAAPTIGFNCEKIRTRLGCSFTLWDVGGQDKLRPLWRSYTRCTDGIIFVVDSCKEDRLEEAKLELQRMCRTHLSVPLLVLANKQDLPAALETSRLESLLGLKELPKGVTWQVQGACAVTGEGLEEGLARLQAMIRQRRRGLAKKREETALFGFGSNSNSSKAKATKKVKRSHSHHY